MLPEMNSFTLALELNEQSNLIISGAYGYRLTAKLQNIKEEQNEK